MAGSAEGIADDAADEIQDGGSFYKNIADVTADEIQACGLFCEDEEEILITGTAGAVRERRSALEAYHEKFWRSESGRVAGGEWDRRYEICDARIAQLESAPKSEESVCQAV